MLLPDVTATGRPPGTDLTHSRHHHLVEGRLESQRLVRLIQGGTDCVWDHSLRRSEQPFDSFSLGLGEQHTNRPCSVGRLLAASNLVAHQPKLLHSSV